MADDSSLMSMDEFFQNTPIGSIDRAIGNNLYGFNHRQVPGMVPMNKDQYGLTFFVRPQLNLRSGNIRANRRMYPLLTANDVSLQRFVRCTLDPRMMVGGIEGSHAISCPFVDNDQAFIPILTNNLTSISGWPDLTSPTFTSKAGVYNEVYSQVDGIVRNFESFDIDATFRNTRGDPIVFMFYIWLHYQSSVFEGTMVPYIDYLLENTIDYNTRIYRLVLDETKQYVKKIAATGVAYPISVPIGSFMDYNSERPFNDQNKDITIRFRCLGAEYLDDILINEFNQTVKIFNQSMKAVEKATRKTTTMNIAGGLVQVPQEMLSFFNHRGYPWINPDNYRLEWWIPKNIYDARVDAMYSNAAMDINGSASAAQIAGGPSFGGYNLKSPPEGLDEINIGD